MLPLFLLENADKRSCESGSRNSADDEVDVGEGCFFCGSTGPGRMDDGDIDAIDAGEDPALALCA